MRQVVVVVLVLSIGCLAVATAQGFGWFGTSAVDYGGYLALGLVFLVVADLIDR